MIANDCKLVQIKFCTACNKILLLVAFKINTSTPAISIKTSDQQEPFFTVDFTHLHNTFIKCESAAILAYRLFARPSHMVQNYIYWWASCTVGLPKQRQVHCLGSPTVQLAHQHVWFCTMWPGRAKGLFWSICRDGGARKNIIEAIYMVKLSFQAFSSVWLSSPPKKQNQTKKPTATTTKWLKQASVRNRLASTSDSIVMQMRANHDKGKRPMVSCLNFFLYKHIKYTHFWPSFAGAICVHHCEQNRHLSTRLS